MPAYRIRISIRDCEPPCVRTLLVPKDFSFLELAGAVNIAMEWWEGHPYEFIVPSRQVTLADMVVETGTYRQMPESTPISKFEGDRIVYTYDFGDEWTHDIEFEGTDPDYDNDFPRMVSFEGRSPPEDCGGVWGYRNLLEALADPANPRHGDLSAWAEGMGFGDFSMEETDEDLQMVRHGMFHPFGEESDMGQYVEEEDEIESYPEELLDESFWEDMERYRGFDPGECLRVECPSPRPTYRDLEGEPLDWFLHWRSECMEDKVTPEDTGYVWLYMAELVNSEDPLWAMERLSDLHESLGSRNGDVSAAFAEYIMKNSHMLTLGGIPDPLVPAPFRLAHMDAETAGLYSGVSFTPKYSSLKPEDIALLVNRTIDVLEAYCEENGCGMLDAVAPDVPSDTYMVLADLPVRDRESCEVTIPRLEPCDRFEMQEYIPKCVANAMWRLDHERGGTQIPKGYSPMVRDIAKRVVGDWADGKEFDPRDYLD